MPQARTPRNRGPAAAPANRDALIAAGRRLFAREGYEVPLSAIAREAGVGQGVLYRHFPDRLSLALAVFTETIDALAAVAAEPTDASRLGRLVDRLIQDVLDNAAFVDAVVNARHLPEFDGEARIRALLADPLAHEQAEGRVRPDLTVEDLMLLIRCVYGCVRTQPEGAEESPAPGRLVALVDPGLARLVDRAAAARPRRGLV